MTVTAVAVTSGLAASPRLTKITRRMVMRYIQNGGVSEKDKAACARALMELEGQQPDGTGSHFDHRESQLFGVDDLAEKLPLDADGKARLRSTDWTPYILSWDRQAIECGPATPTD